MSFTDEGPKKIEHHEALANLAGEVAALKALVRKLLTNNGLGDYEVLRRDIPEVTGRDEAVSAIHARAKQVAAQIASDAGVAD